ncbi:MAG: hypothetical protein A2Y38_02735 [Spirochaetes bacterium GWB1_59_5]|nr:MAG: hypothetical protein A2Y38_02735 [Spirochaetes bacterium GWB1_59_5]
MQLHKDQIPEHLLKYFEPVEETWPDGWVGSLGLEPTPELYVEHLVLIFQELRRVLHPTGTFWLNLGDSYMSHAAKDMASLGGREGERVADEEGYEDTVLFGHAPVAGLKDKDLVGIPWRAALALQADGWWLRNSIIWQKSNPMPSSVQDRFSCKYEFVFLFAKQARYYFDLEAVKVPSNSTSAGKNPGNVWTLPHSPYKGAHFACWPPKLVERMILAGSSEKGRCPTCKAPWGRVVDRKWAQPTRQNYKAAETAHWKGLQPTGRIGGFVGGQVATKGWQPTCECPAHEPERSVVLDPFSGSATTGLVALQLGRNYVGLDLNEKYLPLALARLEGRAAPKTSTDSEPNLIEELFGV